MLDKAFVLIWMRNRRKREMLLRLLAQCRPGQQGVCEQRGHLEEQAEQEQRRIDGSKLSGGLTNPGSTTYVAK